MTCIMWKFNDPMSPETFLKSILPKKAKMEIVSFFSLMG